VQKSNVNLFYHSIPLKTRSQAVARIDDRTASQHLQGSRDAIGHVITR